MIKAIDTYYNGNYFRSRLEARWAVFFEEMGLMYQYEPEGFVIDEGCCYLPDFYLPQLDCYVEVKPEVENAYSHPDYRTKWAGLCAGGKKMLLLFGSPQVKPWLMIRQPDFSPFVREQFKRLGIKDRSTETSSVTPVYRNNEWELFHVDTSSALYHLEKAVIAANKKRFEHGAA